jgi:hypothetical protein
MKIIPYLFLLTLSPLSFAEKLEEPCAGAMCSEKMLAIAEEFKAAEGIDLALVPYVSSGECYHLAWNLNPDTVHYGYVLIDTKDNNFYMGGNFAFFYASNPYTQLTVADARTANPNLYEPNHKLLMERFYSYVNMNEVDPTNPWKYWLKAKGESLLLIAQWGNSQRVFCKMQKNL